jgi:hypothetical protein
MIAMSTQQSPGFESTPASGARADVPLELPCAFFVLVLEPQLKAVTDLGRDIPLFRYDALVLPPQNGERPFDPQADRQQLLYLHEQRHIASIMHTAAAMTGTSLMQGASIRHGSGTLVRLADPQPVCNCHGWIFTGGQLGIQDPHIPSILEENGYTVVQSPREGDLAIYRINDGIKHSGVVRRTQPGSPIMVESKWGPFGAFLHPVDAHPGSCTFYRSPRGGHLLAIRPIGK